MGCYVSRYDSLQNTIRRIQNSLQFGYNTVKDLEINFFRYSNQGYLHQKGLNSALKSLKLYNDFWENHNTVQYQFYENLIKNQLGYSLQKLIAVSILLGNAELETKIERLFKNIDLDLSNSVNRQQIHHWVNLLYEVSHKMMIDLLMQVKRSYDSQAGKFKVMVRQQKGEIARAITEKILKDKKSVSLNQFKQSFCDDSELNSILSSRDFRDYCRKFVNFN